jgi:hypothetical protein
MLEGAGDANGEAEAHRGGNDEVREDLDGMLNSIEHGTPLHGTRRTTWPGATWLLRSKQRRLRSHWSKVG